MLALKTTTFWEDLNKVVFDKMGLTAKHICRVAKIPKSTRIGLENGSHPHRKTINRINQVLQDIRPD